MNHSNDLWNIIQWQDHKAQFRKCSRESTVQYPTGNNTPTNIDFARLSMINTIRAHEIKAARQVVKQNSHPTQPSHHITLNI